MANSLTKKSIILVIALAATVLLIALGVFWPAVSYIKKTAKESYELRIFLEQKYEQSLRAHVSKKRLAEIKETMPDFYPFLFKAGDELKLITYLENLALKHNLTQSISGSNLDMVNNNRVSIALNLNGSYTNILKYLNDLEISDYFINVERLQVTPIFPPGSGALAGADLSLTLSLYVNQ